MLTGPNGVLMRTDQVAHPGTGRLHARRHARAPCAAVGSPSRTSRERHREGRFDSCARLMAVVVTVVAVTGLVVVAVPAHAAPRARVATDVKLKGGLNDPKDPNIAVLEFLPQTVKVATGTTVTWEIAGPEPHSVTFVPPGTAPPSVDKDPSLFTPTPATGPYDGTTLVNSGVLPLGETSEVQKFSMSFAQPRQVHVLLRAAPRHGGHAAGHERHAGLAKEDHQGGERRDQEVPRRG